MCNQLKWITLAHKLQRMTHELFLLASLNETDEHVGCVNYRQTVEVEAEVGTVRGEVTVQE